MDENKNSQSTVLKESNKGKYQDKIIKDVSPIKNLDKQESRNECISVVGLPKMEYISDMKPENVYECYNPTDDIFNTLNWSEGEISQNKDYNTKTVSLMPKNTSVTEYNPNLSQSFEPWSVHRTPAKLRGIYLWSPFFKAK